MDMQQIRFGKPGSVNPFEGWGLPLGVSYPRHASRRPGRSTKMNTATNFVSQRTFYNYGAITID